MRADRYVALHAHVLKHRPNFDAVYLMPLELSICILSTVITAEKGPKREFGGREGTVFTKLSTLNY